MSTTEKKMNDLLQNLMKSEVLIPKKDKIISVLESGTDEVLISTIKLVAKLNAKLLLNEQQQNTRDNMVQIILDTLP